MTPDPRWDSATVEKVARALDETIPFYGTRYSDKTLRECARAVLEASGAVPAEEHERLERQLEGERVDAIHEGDRADRAEAELRAYRERCDRMEEALKRVVWHDDFGTYPRSLRSDQMAKIAREALASPVSAAPCNNVEQTGRGNTMGDISKHCPTCGAKPGDPCTVVSRAPEDNLTPGEPRPTPHFYRHNDHAIEVSVKDEPGP